MILTSFRRLLIAGLCCAIMVWFAGSQGRFIIVLTLLLFGPGYLIEHLFSRPTVQTMFQRPALWLGLSLSCIALLYQWATAFGLSLTPFTLSILTVGCGLGVIRCAWHDLGATASNNLRAPTAPPQWLHLNVISGLALLIVLGLTLWLRFVQIRDLALPAWVDSVHHALMIRITAETGQTPYSLRPYLPVDNVTYHWGYHVFTAAVMQLSGITIPQIMLWEGQILNTLHGLTCAALATYLWRRPIAGVTAAIVVGLVSIMPAYYVSWGRYTQLTGLLLLPPLAITWHAGLRQPSWRHVISMGVLLAGLSVTHFRVLVLALSYIVAMSIIWAVTHPWPTVCARLRYALTSAGLSLVLAGPWLGLLIARALRPIIERPQTLISSGSYTAINESVLWAGQNSLLFALALIAAFWGIWRRKQVALGLIGWGSIMTALANPWMVNYILPVIGGLCVMKSITYQKQATGLIQLSHSGFAQFSSSHCFPNNYFPSIAQRRILLAGVGGILLLFNPTMVKLPYSWLITNDVVAISLFIPFAILIGGGVALCDDWLKSIPIRLYRRIARSCGVIAIGIGAIWGTNSLIHVINPQTVLATSADVTAIDWVATNTPPDARFLINSAGWLPAANRGSDGGWWIAPLLGRWVSVPPVLYTYGDPDYAHTMLDLNKRIANFKPGQEAELFHIIKSEQITHIYLNNRVGPITAEVFRNQEGFTQIYDHDGVTIFVVNAHQ